MYEFLVFGQAVTLLEVVAVLTGLVSVWLTLRLDVLTWPLGIVSVGCYAFVFASAKLYADAALQIAFVVTGLYGWQQWRRARSVTSDLLPVEASESGEWIASITTSAIGILAIGGLLAHLTDSPAPFADASVFVLSLMATLLQALRRINGWWFWIVVDVISLPLYWSRALYLTAMLYLVFLGLSIAGLKAWRSRVAAAQS